VPDPSSRNDVGPSTPRPVIVGALSGDQMAVDSVHARQRGPGERADAQLESWRILRRIRCCPHRAMSLVEAVLVLAV
jgi:hypothetical protein